MANGVILKKELHNEFHKRYGTHNNTLIQFKEFFKEKTGTDFVLKFEFGVKKVEEKPDQMIQDNRIQANT